MTLDELRRRAVAQTLFAPVSLGPAMRELGFVQADPIRAPARAQDLVLRHRVTGYREGDLERRYAGLGLEEDWFVNYGFLEPGLRGLMHPRTGGGRPWSDTERRRARDLLAFLRSRGEAHPAEVDEHFAHGSVTNYWGGRSSATTRLLDLMLYRGMVRVVRREAGVRVFAPAAHDRGPVSPTERDARLDALADAVGRLYGPLPAPSLGPTLRRLRFAVPQWAGEMTRVIARARDRFDHAAALGVDWSWPARRASLPAPEDRVRLLAPFDPVVWDRRRFELLWGWSYRFEAYTPAARRKRAYYALPLLWRDEVIGWASVEAAGGRLEVRTGFARGRPRGRSFTAALSDEVERLRGFLLSGDG